MPELTFARSKIQPPQFRLGLIERPGLESRLGAALLDCRLVTLVAPAGYGKTAAMARQLGLLPEGCASAWVRADAEDDLPRMLACIVASMEALDPPWRISPEAMTRQVGSDHGVRKVVDELVNTLDAMPVLHGVIALDDLHAVADDAWFVFLGQLLNALPDRWTIAMATRVDPPLALARLRVRSEVAEFRETDLGFDRHEIRLLFDMLGRPLDEVQAERLHARTNGWPAGVCIGLDAVAAEEAGGQEDARLNRRRLFEYLAIEVFEPMTSELQDFLVSCSMLPELTAARCVAVSGNPRALLLLEEIERRGLFVSVLDSEEYTLRLHDLFRDFLAERLRRRDGDEMRLLLRRAAWSETDAGRKVSLLLRADAPSDAEQMLLEVAPSMLASGETSQLARLLERFPPGMRASSAKLIYAAGLVRQHQFEDVAVQTHMHLAAAGFDALGLSHLAQRARLMEAVALLFLGRFDEALEAFRQSGSDPIDREAAVMVELFQCAYTGIHGPVPAPGEHLDRIIDLLGDDAPEELWFRCIPRVHMLVGRPGIAGTMQRFVARAIRAAGDENAPLFAAVKVVEVWMLLWQGDCTRAAAAIERIKEESDWLGKPRSLRIALLRASAAYHALRGNRAGVAEAGAALLSDAPSEAASMHWRVNILSVLARYAATVDDWPLVRQALEEGDRPEVQISFGPMKVALRILQARHALHEGRNDEALVALRKLVPLTNHLDQMGINASARVYLAVAELRVGTQANAWEALERLFPLTMSERQVGGVLLTGPTMLEELANARWDHGAPEGGQEILRRWLELAMRLRAESGATDQASGMLPLSARELEVLDFIAAGHSNKVIARAMALSPHTIKRHVARILQRLDLSSRAQAAAWYVRHRAAHGESNTSVTDAA